MRWSRSTRTASRSASSAWATCCRWSRTCERKVDQDKAQKLAEKVIKGKRFDLNDMRDQLEQMLNMGGMAGLIDKLPGMGKMPEHVKDQVNDKDVDAHDRDHRLDDEEGAPPSRPAQRLAHARASPGAPACSRRTSTACSSSTSRWKR